MKIYLIMTNHISKVVSQSFYELRQIGSHISFVGSGCNSVKCILLLAPDRTIVIVIITSINSNNIV